MKSIFITTILGPDSIGIIKSLANTTHSLEGEWLNSKVIKLDGQFTAIMKVVIDQEREAHLKSTLEKDFSELQFVYAPARSDKKVPPTTVNLIVDCNDRPGLIKEINTVLSNLDLPVENMEFNRFHVSGIGEAVFSAKLTLAVPEGMAGEAIADEIETLSDDMRVSIA